jgi:hypothetical protein
LVTPLVTILDNEFEVAALADELFATDNEILESKEISPELASG